MKKILNKHKDTRPEEPPNNPISDPCPNGPLSNNSDGDEGTTITYLTDENVVTPNNLQHDVQQDDGIQSEGGQDEDSQDEGGQDQSGQGGQDGQDDPKYEVVPIEPPPVLPGGEQADDGNERAIDSGFASGEGGEGQVNEVCTYHYLLCGRFRWANEVHRQGHGVVRGRGSLFSPLDCAL